MPDWKAGDYIGGSYRLERLLGQGGMGEVWLAQKDTPNAPFVALKIVPANQSHAAQQLRSEYDALKQLVHPHLPRVYEQGQVDGDGGASYLAMEYLQGEELHSDILANPLEDIIDVMVQLSRALAFLHTHRIIHGDLKPQNIVVSQRQPLHLKLIDFGLATVASETSGNQLRGTVPYIAPEQLRGEKPGPASDLYATGVIVFRLLTGRFPFEAESEALTLRARLEQEAPSLLKYAPRVSVSLADIVARLLRRNPDERPGNAREVIALINEKLGRVYPYETPQSRVAYLNSSAYHPYIAIQEKIDVSFGKPVVITAEPRMGLRSFLNDTKNYFEKRGIPVQRFSGDEWKQANPSQGTVWVVGPFEAMPAQLPEAASLIVGIETEEPNDSATFRLPHLDIRDTEDMLQAIFGQHRFPKDFVKHLWLRTLGHVDAADEILQELLNRELIDVGIEGWEWYGSETDWPVPESLLRLWQMRFQKLDSSHRRALAFLAFAFNHTLAKDIWDKLCDTSSEEQAVLADSLQKQGWIHIGETVALRSPIHTSAICSSLPIMEAREIHERLSELPPPLHEAIAEMTHYVGHQLLSSAPKLNPGEAFAKLRQSIRQGQAKTVSELSTEAMEMIPNISAAWKAVLLLLSAESTALAGSLSRAQEAAQRAVDVAREATLPGDAAEGRLVLAHILERQGEWDEAEKYLSDCYEKAPFLPKDRMMILLSTWAWIRFRKGDIDEASRLAEQALAQGGEAAKKNGRLRQTLGNLAYYRGDLDSAAREWEAALDDYEKHDDARGKSDIYNNLGVIAARWGKAQRAREHWEMCKKLSEETGNQARVAGLLNNLAISAFEEGDFRLAEKNYEEALRIYRRLDAPREHIEILNNLGELSFYRANYPRARAFWNEALSDAEALGDVEAQIEPLIYLGKLSSAIGASEESQRFFEQAISTSREAGNEPGLARALGEFALHQMLFSDLEKANQLLDEADNYVQDDTDPALKLNLFYARSQLLLAAEENEKAADLYESVRTLPEATSTFVARAHLGLFALAHGKTPPDDSWFADIREFPEFSWRASWYQAQKFLTNQDRKSMLREVEKAAARLRMIAEQLSEKERGSYLQSSDVVRFQKWVKEAV